VILYNNQSGDAPPLYGSSISIKIPVVSVTNTAGAALVTALAAGPVNVTVQRAVSIDRDGTIDNTIVAHEWGHYISNRLVGNGSGLDNNQGGGLGEGWGDFHALMLAVAEEDTQRGLTPPFSGVYALSTYVSSGGANQGYYYGIRRIPYSTRMDADPLTFKHIQDGLDLPAGVPIAGGTDGSFNAEVHNSGEVWATMLWEGYAALLHDSARLTFAQAQDRMKRYLVGSYKMTPLSPTFLEARDAVLAVALAADLQDYTLLAQAFARRGAGNEAVAPDRGSQDNRPVVEDYSVGGNLAFVEATIADDVQSCDQDGRLDNGETGTLTVVLKNTGTAALSQTTGTVASTLSGVTFPDGPTLTFPASPPKGVVTTTLKVALVAVQGVQSLPLSISFTDPGLARPRTLTAAFSARANLDEVAAASPSDDVEGTLTAWTTAYDALLGNGSPFRRVTDSTGGRWFVPNAAQPESQSLVSPALTVPAVGPFLFTFRHRFDFEADQRGRYDGAVLEAREEGTTSWVDLGQYARPGYTGTLTTGTQYGNAFYPSANPLKGRKAWSGRSNGYPQFLTVTVDLGTRFAGKILQIRFRVGTDDGTAATGWDLDDFQFANLDNTPFPAMVLQSAECNTARPVASSGTTLEVIEGETVSLLGTASHPSGAPLTYAWTQLSGPAGTLAGADTLTPTFTAPKVVKDELARFALVATSGTESSPPAIARVLIKDVNRTPVAAVVTPVTAAPGDEVVLDGSGSSDQDGDTLAFKWTQTGGPEVTLSSAAADKPTFTCPDVGNGTQLTFALEVQDAKLTSERAILVVTVNAGAGQDVDTGSGGGAPKAQGCACAAPGVDGSLLLGLGGLVFALRRRREARG
ncbi:MAG: M36 family metallopeptidase, partial [Deltaproteobacteria bacterium]|nr:M36 family metallopeptidase [Deltaproteobacteria bacterium]